MAEEQVIDLQGQWNGFSNDVKNSLLYLCKQNLINEFVQSATAASENVGQLGNLLYGHAQKILEEEQKLEEELKQQEELKHQEDELKHQEEELKHQEEELKQKQEYANSTNAGELWKKFDGDQKTTLKTLAASGNVDNFCNCIQIMNSIYNNKPLALKMFGHVSNLLPDQEKSSSFLEHFPFNLFFEKEKRKGFRTSNKDANDFYVKFH